MKRFAATFVLTFCLAMLAGPAFCQEYAGGYNPYQMQGMPGDLNCSHQPLVQYYNPVGLGQMPQYGVDQPDYAQMQYAQPQSFNQMVMPTQVPYQPQAPQNFQQFNNNAMTPYQQQEQALEQAQMAQQMEEVKQRKEVDENFHVSTEFDDNRGNRAIDDHNRGASKTRAASKAVAGGVGKLMKNGMRYAGPAAGTVASFFLLRAAFGGGNGMMVMPVGGGMMIAP